MMQEDGLPVSFAVIISGVVVGVLIIVAIIVGVFLAAAPLTTP